MEDRSPASSWSLTTFALGILISFPQLPCCLGGASSEGQAKACTLQTRQLRLPLRPPPPPPSASLGGREGAQALTHHPQRKMWSPLPGRGLNLCSPHSGAGDGEGSQGPAPTRGRPTWGYRPPSRAATLLRMWASARCSILNPFPGLKLPALRCRFPAPGYEHG